MKIRRVPRLLTVLLLGLLALGALPAGAFTAGVAQAAASVCAQGSYACWMGADAGQIGQRPLNQTIMPASHDSGTYGFPVALGFSYVRTQSGDITDQLVAGARAFDVRAKVRDDNADGQSGPRLVIYHGSINSELRLSDVLKQFHDFATDPGAVKEILYLNISTDSSSHPELVQAQCEAFARDFQGIALPPQLVKDANGFLSLNEIWALPNHPRVIVEWDDCRNKSYGGAAVQGFWNQNGWSGNGSYYANQPDSPCVIYYDSYGLQERRQAVDPPDGTPAPFPDPSVCVPVDVFGKIGPPEHLGDPVPNLFVLFIQQSGLFPDFGTDQEFTIDAVRDWYRNNEHNARSNLSYVSGDFMTSPDYYDVGTVVGLNLPYNGDNYAGGPQISVVTTPAGGGQYNVTATCRTSGGVALPAGALRVLDNSSAGASAGAPAGNPVILKVTVSSAIFQCNDGSNRRARLVVDPAGTILGGTATALAGTATAVAGPYGTTLLCTGAPQAYTVPAGVTGLGVSGAGGSGADAGSQTSRGGRGALATARLAVTPGQRLTVYVGCAGKDRSGGYGYGGGGGGGDEHGSVSTTGGGGGGGTAIVDATSGTVLLVLGGGGAAGGFGSVAGQTGGNGGDAGAGVTGASGGGDGTGGSDGSVIGGGGGGGGGGGYQGGGGGGGGTVSGGGGGGAGSSYTNSTVSNESLGTAAGPGDGYLTLTYDNSPQLTAIAGTATAVAATATAAANQTAAPRQTATAAARQTATAVARQTAAPGQTATAAARQTAVAGTAAAQQTATQAPIDTATAAAQGTSAARTAISAQQTYAPTATEYARQTSVAQTAVAGTATALAQQGIFDVPFGCTGAPQTFTVPANVHAIIVQAVGGGAASSGRPGRGGVVTGTVSVTSGQTLTIWVGCQGGGRTRANRPDPSNPGPGGYGWANGGAGGLGHGYLPGGYGGGGASAVSIGSGTPVLVAAGGGAAGGDVSYTSYHSGNGGNANVDGTAGSDAAGGKAGGARVQLVEPVATIRPPRT